MALDLDNPYELAFVVNTGDKELSFPIPGSDKSGNQARARIAPGERKMMPFDTIASAFGNPRARNLSHKDRSREELYQTLRVYWGFHIGFDVETEDEKTEIHQRNGTSSWELKCPRFRVETVDGQYVPMVLDDPEGQHPLPDDTGYVDGQTALSSGNSAVMERTLARLIERDAERDAVIADLVRRLEERGEDVKSEDVTDTVPSNFSSDEPTAAPEPSTSQLPEPPANEPAPKVDRPRGARIQRPAE